MKLGRGGGVLLHPTSLPSQDGIGTVGFHAYRLVDWLEETNQKYWQILPLGPTGYGDSPYATFSSVAGNPLLIDLFQLRDRHWLQDSDLDTLPKFQPDKIDYGQTIQWKIPLLRKAASKFLSNPEPNELTSYEDFCYMHREWIDDYALFMAVKEFYDQKAIETGVSGQRWYSWWENDIKLRTDEALEIYSQQFAKQIQMHKVWQWWFFTQWLNLKSYANSKGIQIIGDIPIFVAPDSADVWANPELFQLDDKRNPTHVAGVPPDLFSDTGQLWGNPLFNWKTMQNNRFAWWERRLQIALQTVDWVRIDHFRGFEAFWEVPADHKTAQHGRWVEAPGIELFDRLRSTLGELPIIAEDLGVITPEVEALRDRYNFPGMKILQFAFTGNGADVYLPHSYPRNCVCYSGTHDNNTTVGWYENPSRTDYEKNMLENYLGYEPQDISWDLLRLAWSSVADLSIAPMQDLLSLNEDARMNTPSTASGNWQWRMTLEQWEQLPTDRLRSMTHTYGR